MADQVALLVPLITDPSFVTLSDQESADEFNLKKLIRVKNSLTPEELFNAIDQTEFLTLTPEQKTDVRDLYQGTVVSSVDMTIGSRAMDILDDAFVGGGVTQLALVAARDEQVSSAQLAGVSQKVGRGWVINARRIAGIYINKDQSSLTEIGRV